MGLKEKYKKNRGMATPPSSIQSISTENEKEYEIFRGAVQYRIIPQGFIESDEFLWVVMIVKNAITKEKVKVVGTTSHYNVGDYLEFYGHWVKRNGETQFQFDYAIRVDDDYVGAIAMLAFLFGTKLAQRIVDAYDNKPQEAIQTFKENSDVFKGDMKGVKGIGDKRILKAYEKFKKYKAVDALYFKFVKFNLSLNKAIKLVKLWGSAAADIMDENVYQLINVDGFTFETIDRIGLEYYKFDKNDGRRIEAFLIQLLKESTRQGDCYMQLEQLVSDTTLGLSVSENIVRERIIELITKNKLKKSLYNNEIIIYLPYIYKAEENVAAMVSSAVRKNNIVKESRVEELIEEYEISKGIKLHEKQKKGIHLSSISNFSIISGPPGSGKTTLIDCICYIFKKHKRNCNIKLAALSGKAATKMSDSTGMESSTIHRLLGFNETGYTFNENNPLSADVVIIDEISMVDIVLFERLMKAISVNTVVILTGDKDQLPSVDCGQVLSDLLKVDYIPKTILQEIFRQKKGSTILERALDYNMNKIPNLTKSKDFQFIQSDDVDNTLDILLNTYEKKVDEYGINNVCLMVPQNVKMLGGDILNLELQRIINPKDAKKSEITIGSKKVFREGDRVIQLQNMAEKNLFNGMVGTISECIPSPQKIPSQDTLVVDFDNGTQQTYLREDLDMLKLAYALTVHKSQGSEYECILMLLSSLHKFMLRKKLVYTGMTRAKKELIMIGEEDMIKYSLLNKERERKTRLTYLLKQYEL